MIFDRFRSLISEPKGDFDDGAHVNQAIKRRNLTITLLGLGALTIIAISGYWYITPSQVTETEQGEKPVAFGEVVTDDFTEKDNQSALTQQQLQIDQMKLMLNNFKVTLESFGESIDSGLGNISAKAERDAKNNTEGIKQELTQKLAKVAELETQLERLINEQKNAPSDNVTSIKSNVNGSGEKFGDYNYRYPPTPATQYSDNNPNKDDFSYKNTSRNSADSMGFETKSFHWEATVEEAKSVRTTDNYVPTGTFVTAVVTGGADANAGVSGQGDTAPIVFQTINSGILPNGKKSKLGNCTITGSIYGEISSSRGITRTNRMSCIQPNGAILDIPVRATAFNFGRNGIRGTTILKNGKIVEMAGVSGILTGIGETGKALSQTTTPTALGPSQSVNGGDALVNLLGNATSSVGSKLADYYIKLAELYHPIVEVNPGAVVNIVFLEGFPLDPLLANEYEAKLERKEKLEKNTPENQLMSVLTNSSSATANQTVNPLAEKLAQEGIPNSQFGTAQ